MKHYLVAIPLICLFSCQDDPIVLEPCIYSSLADEVEGIYYGHVSGSIGTIPADTNYIVNISILNDSMIVLNGKDFSDVEITLDNYETQITGRFDSTGFFFYGKDNQCIDILISPAQSVFDYFGCRVWCGN